MRRKHDENSIKLKIKHRKFAYVFPRKRRTERQEQPIRKQLERITELPFVLI